MLETIEYQETAQPDEMIRQALLEEWLTVLSHLWTAYDKPLDPIRLTVYRDALGKVPLGLLEKAIERVLKENIYNIVPPVAVVWNAIRKELGNPYDIDQAIEEWMERRWRSCCYRFDSVAVETEG